jgi:hypothetical protein
MACTQRFGINQVVRELEKAFFCHSEFISESLNLRVFKYMRFRIPNESDLEAAPRGASGGKSACLPTGRE